jgi:hypothetical protein
MLKLPVLQALKSHVNYSHQIPIIEKFENSLKFNCDEYRRYPSKNEYIFNEYFASVRRDAHNQRAQHQTQAQTLTNTITPLTHSALTKYSIFTPNQRKKKEWIFINKPISAPPYNPSIIPSILDTEEEESEPLTPTKEMAVAYTDGSLKLYNGGCGFILSQNVKWMQLSKFWIDFWCCRHLTSPKYTSILIAEQLSL